MSKSLVQAVRRGIIALLLLAGTGAAVPAARADRPYTESEPARGLHLFNRPKKGNPADQWAYVQALDRAGKTRAARRQALSLRLFWPHSPEAPAAQMLHARLLDRRGKLQDAFDAYQYLIKHYPGRFDFREVLDRQMALATELMDRRKGRFLFFPGFDAPERAVPLFEQIASNAPEWPRTAEAYYRIGVARQRVYEYATAIDAFFTTLNRFPDSEFAEPAAFRQAQCHIKLAAESPQDDRALETAIAACDLYLQRYPDTARASEVGATRQRLQDQRAANSYARARYYDRILRNPEAAIIEYRAFIARFPQAKQVPTARQRIQKLITQRKSRP